MEFYEVVQEDFYTASIVEGGLGVMLQVTLTTPGTSVTMRRAESLRQFGKEKRGTVSFARDYPVGCG